MIFSPLSYSVSYEEAASVTAFSKISLLSKYSKESNYLHWGEEYKRMETTSYCQWLTHWQVQGCKRWTPWQHVLQFPLSEKIVFTSNFENFHFKLKCKSTISEESPVLHASFSPLFTVIKQNKQYYLLVSYSHCWQQYKLLTFLRDNLVCLKSLKNIHTLKARNSMSKNYF